MTLLVTPHFGAPGPDGVTLAQVKTIDVKMLTGHFNLWLLAGHPPAAFYEGITVLIPKTITATKPEEYRPITMGQMVGRVYHRLLAARFERQLPLNVRQKAFRHGDGLAENSFLLQSIIRDHQSGLRPLCVTFLDVRKAFDSVSHETILRAVQRLGVPQRLREYVADLYSGVTTRIRVGSQVSAEMVVGRGVRQGDPLSPLLFNAVIDWVMSEVDRRFGAKVGKLTVTYLAYADDIVLLTESPIVMQEMLDTVTEALALAGLQVNEEKSASLRIVVDGSAKRWLCHPGAYLSVGEKLLPALNINQTYKYLGTGFGAAGTSTTVTEKLSDGLVNLTRAPLKPQQRMYLLVRHLVPSLYHQLTFAEMKAGRLKDMDRRIRKEVRAWLRIPPDTPVPYFHADPKDGGLGIPILQFVVPVLKKTRVENLEKSSDPVVQEMIRCSILFQHLRGKLGGGNLAASTTMEIKTLVQQKLYMSVDGAGLRNHSAVSSIHRWVTSGTRLLTGRSYISAVQVRGNLVATRARMARARRPGAGRESVACDACGRPESLGHILQVCPKTALERNSRHNRIRDYVAKKAQRKGWEVRTETPFPTPAGVRRPDLILYKTGMRACVIDVTVVADNASLSATVRDKITYYDTPAIRRAVGSIAAVPETLVQFGAVALNWRGAMARESDQLLTGFHFTTDDKELISVQTLEGAAQILAANRSGTWRQRHRRNH
jgi:hypothetical protein